ncbi:MAG: MaoC family dehydratase [Bryobacteraceae bacterium]|nr:MaoC family dehydratase [Bryobacteraceae bacterium]
MTSIDGIEGLRALLRTEAGVSEWLTVTQRMIDDFARLTGDPQWIHEDTERTRRESPFRGPIAHGFLTASLISPLRNSALKVNGDFRMGVNYGFNRLRFAAPVPAGARVRGRYTPKEIRDIEGGWEITWGVLIEVEGGGKPALGADWVTRLYAA